MNITEFCSELDLQLGLSAPEERLNLAIKVLQKAFKVTADEVALFSFDPKFEVLRFVWPKRLSSSGVIPLASKTSLVSRTAKNKRGYLDNLFHNSAHSFIFEMKTEPKGEAGQNHPIQKILSAPMTTDGTLKGVIQISRKGSNPKEAGADFTQAELDALTKMASIIGRHQ